jgi:uncharacterized protein
MSFDPLDNQTANRAAYGSDIDAGLQAHMRKIYNVMSIGLGITGLVSWGVAATPALVHAIYGTPLFYLVALAPLAFLWFGFTPKRIASMSAGQATTMFALFSAIMGLSMGSIFLVYTAQSIARVFFISAATFASASLYGYTAKRDLTKMGSFMAMGFAGIFFASLFNLFFHSAAIQFATSIIGVVVFTGLAAWDTQFIKESYRHGDDGANSQMAITGALRMYLNFINLFNLMLNLLGNRR